MCGHEPGAKQLVPWWMNQYARVSSQAKLVFLGIRPINPGVTPLSPPCPTHPPHMPPPPVVMSVELMIESKILKDLGLEAILTNFINGHGFIEVARQSSWSKLLAGVCVCISLSFYSLEIFSTYF